MPVRKTCTGYAVENGCRRDNRFIAKWSFKIIVTLFTLR